ncbi:hypothetical protein IP98_02128 [Flavobacterium cauense R2A-7]|uniref:Panthothenate synthetase n=1 Tax=Flavobacterium cauense R2A-7 TaxID=1341154 RepID=A0A562LTC3_9FLAO|nr:hypothetical protein [Flavobacterium cauense]KGO82941.1 panthothenate synthetase [Flavobacterium cauense R2A-7]TWI10778.1 hypothetical protein IP98_02128 [Flavobacterium cauense R2A-7]
MKMLVNVIMPIEPFNSLVRNGKAGEILGRIIEDIKPESIYFTEIEGNRGAVIIVDIKDASTIPAVAEPWFLNFEASCEFKIAMTPDDLMKSDLAKLAAKWYDVHVM